MHFVNMVGTGLSAIEQTANISPLANLEVHRPFVRPAVHCFAIFAAGVLLCGCTRASVQANGFGGDSNQGAYLIQKFGCGTCHTIPGIADADGQVGPPLNAMGQRVYLAGKLRNTPDNMVRWLRDPQAVVPENVMPNMGLTKAQARDVAAYLYTLE